LRILILKVSFLEEHLNPESFISNSEFYLFQHSHDFSLTVSFIVENCDFMIKFMRINFVEINGHTYPFMTTEELNIFC